MCVCVCVCVCEIYIECVEVLYFCRGMIMSNKYEES